MGKVFDNQPHFVAKERKNARRSVMKKHATITKMALVSLLAVALFSMPVITAADVVGYWRMETDNDPDPEKASIPNEIAGGSPLTSDEAQIHLNVPIDPVPGTGAPNSGSLDPTRVGGGMGINATIAEYGDLNVDSITVEF